jgi:hypothetical protein
MPERKREGNVSESSEQLEESGISWRRNDVPRIRAMPLFGANQEECKVI